MRPSAPIFVVKWMSFTESPLGSLWSSSRDVCLYIYRYIYIGRYVPFHCNFFLGLSLALRSHDQFQASRWSTLLPPLVSVILSASVEIFGVSRMRAH